MPTKTEMRRDLRIFSAASFLNDFGADAIRPFWPLFVTSVLGAPASVLGLLDGLGEVISYGSRFPSGWLSDRLRRRKPIVWLGYLLAGLSRVGYALSPAVAWLFPFKAMDRLGKMRDPPRDALLADVVPKKEHGRAFGLLTAADNAGATLGPLFGLLLFALLSFRGMFAAAAIPSLVGAAGIYILIKEHRPKPHGIRKAKLGKEFYRLAAVAGMFALGWISVSFMVLHATNVEGLPAYLAPALFFIMSAFSVAFSAIFGRLSDRLGKKRMLLNSYLLYAIVAAGFFAIHVAGITGVAGIVASFLLFALYGMHYGGISSIQPAFVVDIVPQGSRAYASGLFSAAFGFAAMFASVAAGILWDLATPAAAFGYAAVVSAAATAAAAALLKG